MDDQVVNIGLNAIKMAIAGVIYVTPLAALIWKVSKADSQIKENKKEIEELKDMCMKDVASKQIPLHETRLENLERDLKTEKERASRMEDAISQLSGDVREVSTKIDILLNYQVEKNGKSSSRKNQ